MKKLLFGLAAGAATLVSFASVASAATPWQSINHREARLEMQIRHGIHTGALNRAEAVRLSGRLHELERLERNFRRGGLSLTERRVLDQRFDALGRSIRKQMADRQIGHGRGFHRT